MWEEAFAKDEHTHKKTKKNFYCLIYKTIIILSWQLLRTNLQPPSFHSFPVFMLS